MAIRYYKKTVECECGIDYGNCTNHNIFIEKEYSVTDTYALFVKRHSDSPESKFECLGYYENCF